MSQIKWQDFVSKRGQVQLPSIDSNRWAGQSVRVEDVCIKKIPNLHKMPFDCFHKLAFGHQSWQNNAFYLASWHTSALRAFEEERKRAAKKMPKRWKEDITAVSQTAFPAQAQTSASPKTNESKNVITEMHMEDLLFCYAVWVVKPAN